MLPRVVYLVNFSTISGVKWLQITAIFLPKKIFSYSTHTNTRTIQSFV